MRICCYKTGGKKLKNPIKFILLYGKAIPSLICQGWLAVKFIYSEVTGDN